VTPARTQLLVAAALALLTAAELGVAYVHVAHGPRLAALTMLALAQAAAIIGLGMELAREPRPLRLAFVGTLVLPFIYAAALIGEALAGSHGP
jgi:FtsH-binding integral membrane protein